MDGRRLGESLASDRSVGAIEKLTFVRDIPQSSAASKADGLGAGVSMKSISAIVAFRRLVGASPCCTDGHEFSYLYCFI